MTTTFESLWHTYQPIIAGIAADYGGRTRRWGGSHEDFSQEFAVWMMDNEKTLAQVHTEITDPDEFGRYLAKCLRNEAHDYMLDIRAQGGGQDRATAYWYTPGELEVLLDAVFDREAWLNPPQSDGKSVSDPAHGNNWVSTLADVARAFERVSADDQALLRAFHEDRERNKDMALDNGVTEATMSYRHKQAIKRLLKHLGGERPIGMRPHERFDPWRGRHAVTNAAARATQGSYYDE